MPIRSFLGRQPVKQTRRTFLQWLLGLSQLNVLLGFFNQGKLRAETPATKSAIDAGKGEVRFLIFGDWGREDNSTKVMSPRRWVWPRRLGNAGLLFRWETIFTKAAFGPPPIPNGRAVRGYLYRALFGCSLVCNLRQPRLQRPARGAAKLRQDAFELEDARTLFLRGGTDHRDRKNRILLHRYEPIRGGVPNERRDA